MEQTPKDGIDRRDFLKCMAWAGTGALYTVSGGVLSSIDLNSLLRGGTAAKETVDAASFSFVQISDSHIGFGKDANKNVLGTLQEAVAKINGLPASPELMLHTGDLSHLSKDDEFDALDQILTTARAGNRFFVPGEHDVLVDNGKNYRARYGKGTVGDGWYSFNHRGVHFIGLVNVLNLKAGGMGNLGEEQLAWLEKNVRGLSSSTPIVVFAHVPLWEVYPEWGWGTDDGARALALLKRFGSVTVLNGHIHPSLQKVEGNVTFHTAMSTAFPQPKPGQAKGPGPMVVPAGELRNVLGITTVNFAPRPGQIAVVDSTLAVQPSQGSDKEVVIDNFTFAPAALSVPRGARVTWLNSDDMAHTVVEEHGRFKSPPLDTEDKYAFRFDQPGTYSYFCSIHPRMQGKVIVS
ncbi:MAG TPA: metallophosphoesterase [Fimbriimonas sp.]|nr:metallophosphoesterase [Fimbriimonas sp.]